MAGKQKSTKFVFAERICDAPPSAASRHDLLSIIGPGVQFYCSTASRRRTHSDSSDGRARSFRHNTSYANHHLSRFLISVAYVRSAA
jgi:hypothetical protein